VKKIDYRTVGGNEDKGTEVLEKIEQRAVLITAAKGEVESSEEREKLKNFAIIVSIYNRLEPKVEDLCEAHRLFLKETEIKEDSHTFKLFLFNDILIKAKQKEHKLKLSMHISLLTAEIVDVAEDSKQKHKNCYQIVTPRRTILVEAKSAEEKKEWISLINECKDKLIVKSKSYKTLNAKPSMDEIR